MAFLNIGTSLNVPVLTSGAKRTTVIAGGAVRAFDLTLRAQVRGRKRERSVTVGPLTAAQEIALLTLIEGNPFQTCSGDIFNGVSTACYIEVEEAEYLPDGLTHRLTIPLLLRDV